MKLYYSKGACSLVIRIIINELGLKSEYESVNLKTKQTESDHNFLTINPKGAVPTLQLDNGEILTENAVILQYLADTNKAHTLLPAIGHIERYRVLEWVNYVTTELHKTFGALFQPTLPAEVKEAFFIPLLKSKLKYVNQQLQGKKYLLGDQFTLPDAYLFVILQWASFVKLSLNEWENLTRYQAELQKRASVQTSLKEEGLL